MLFGKCELSDELGDRKDIHYWELNLAIWGGVGG
jgi:hypothetical protein